MRNVGKAVTDEDVDRDDVEEPESASTFSTAYSKQTLTTLEALNESMVNFDLIIFLLETICFTNQQLARFSSAILIFLPSLDTIRKLCDLLESHRDFGSGAFQVFPLHSSISNDQQGRVFQVRCGICIGSQLMSPLASTQRDSQDCRFDKYSRDWCHDSRHNCSH